MSMVYLVEIGKNLSTYLVASFASIISPILQPFPHAYIKFTWEEIRVDTFLERDKFPAELFRPCKDPVRLM